MNALALQQQHEYLLGNFHQQQKDAVLTPEQQEQQEREAQEHAVEAALQKEREEKERAAAQGMVTPALEAAPPALVVAPPPLPPLPPALPALAAAPPKETPPAMTPVDASSPLSIFRFNNTGLFPCLACCHNGQGLEVSGATAVTTVEKRRALMRGSGAETKAREVELDAYRNLVPL